MEECEQRNLLEFYELGETIGNGGFGAVYAGQSRLTGDSVSVCIHTGVLLYMCISTFELLGIRSWPPAALRPQQSFVVSFEAFLYTFHT